MKCWHRIDILTFMNYGTTLLKMKEKMKIRMRKSNSKNEMEKRKKDKAFYFPPKLMMFTSYLT